MKQIHQGSRYSYWIADNGTIYRKSGKGFKEIPKRLGQRGYCEFKMDNKTVLYHHIVAKHLVPNPKNGNMVFFNSYDVFDLRPQNLRWVWKRQGLTYTPEQALAKAKDKELIELYKTGSKRGFDRRFIEVAKKINAINHDLIGDLYLTIQNYAERCLIFDIERDVKQTFFGLIVQGKRVKLRTVQLNEKII